jgi:hypothetical protein
MCTDGCTDSHHETNIRFSEMCVVPDILHFVYFTPMSRTFWEACRFSCSQANTRNLWNPKVHSFSHKCPTPVHILSQVDPIHASTSHFLKFHLTIEPTPNIPRTKSHVPFSLQQRIRTGLKITFNSSATQFIFTVKCISTSLYLKVGRNNLV